MKKKSGLGNLSSSLLISDQEGGKKIKIVLADDHRVVREGFKLLLEREPDFIVIGEAQTGEEAVTLAQSLMPDVILMDISMPNLNGLQAAYKILRYNPNMKIIILSMSHNEQFVQHSVEIGIRGFLLKENASQEIIKAIREVVVSNNPYYGPEVQEILLKMRKENTESIPSQLLSPREWEVLVMMAEGKSNQEIANTLLISVKTVDHHKHGIKEKLKISTTAGIVQYAIRNGLIPS